MRKPLTLKKIGLITIKVSGFSGTEMRHL